MIVFRTAAEEHVVSVERLADTGEDLDEGDEAADDGSNGEAPDPGDVTKDAPEA